MFDLLYAAAVGDLPSVRYCVQRSQKANFLWGDLTRTCGRGRAALHYAVLGGHDTVVRELIRAGAQLSWQDRDGATCLMIAAERGNELVLQLLLSHGADVHICARDGSTAAHFAARKGHMECLQCLIKAGSHIATTDCMGRTLIHWAAEIGNKAMVELLLEQGCPVSGGTQHVLGETPLHVAVKHGHADVVKLLLRKRAAVNAVTKEGQTPLHVCCSSSLAPAPALQRVAALLLSEKRLHIRALDAQGKPAHFYTKDFTLKDLILMAIQGTLPTPPESDDGMHKKPPVVPPPAAIKPVIATPHPLIPGHRWAESRAECTPRSDSRSTTLETRGPSLQPVTQCPFALDWNETGQKGGKCRAAQLRQEELIWKASQACCHKTTHGSKNTGLIPSDRMWFDSGSHRILPNFPVRQYLGRYRS